MPSVALSNVVLDGMTVSIKDCTTFVNLFGGGADCYIPDFFGNGSLNMTCIFAGVLAAAIYISIQIKERMDKVKKGYEVESLTYCYYENGDHHSCHPCFYLQTGTA